MSIPVDSSTTPAGASRGALVEDLCDFLAQTQPADTPLLCDFARELFAKVPRQLVQERTLEDLAAMTVGAFRFVQANDPDEVNVEVLNPEAEAWSAPVTIIRAQVGDRPFIVDTIREFLSAENVSIHHYVYPVLQVVRDAEGRAVRIGAGENARAEALTHCEVSRIQDPERQQAICHEIRRRLQAVVAATDDFHPMLAAVDETTRLVSG
jgi:glutamate dehydrogenase